MEWLDRLGYDEAWIGEHHSGGFETIASPELFIAGAVERTRNITFGTGVVSLPYHQPLMVANRLIQLDHQARGRVKFGFGPGLLVSDAKMLGIDPKAQRDRMAQALDVILRLMAGESVHRKDRVVRPAGGARASAALYAAAPGNRGRECRNAIRRSSRGQI